MKLLRLIIFGFFIFGFYSIGVGNARLRVNVKEYGAKGDAYTDDTQSILKALDRLLDEGGILYFPEGIYITNVIDIRPNKPVHISVEGDGMGKSIIRKSKADPVEVAVFFCEIPDVALSFSSIGIDGNAKNRPSTWRTLEKNVIDIDRENNGIFAYNVRSLDVQQCKVYNLHGKGIACFSARKFVVHNNVVEDTQGDAIIGHRVDSMFFIDNRIKNAGILPNRYVLDGKIRARSKYFPQVRYGDGLLAAGGYLLAANNEIVNAARCGIVHDIAQDLGYDRSEAVVKNNKVIVNSLLLNNSNPPAGMWFEQTASVLVEGNTIELIRSNSTLISGIRFYGITNSIICVNNTIDAKRYTGVPEEALGIFEPFNVSVHLKSNKIVGKFLRGIHCSYGKPNANLKKLELIENDIQASRNVMKRAVEISIDSKLYFPYNTALKNNVFKNARDKPVYLFFYGQPIVGKANKQMVLSLENNDFGSTISITNHVEKPEIIKLEVK